MSTRADNPTPADHPLPGIPPGTAPSRRQALAALALIAAGGRPPTGAPSPGPVTARPDQVRTGPVAPQPGTRPVPLTPPAAIARWPGHRPGLIHLGQSYPGPIRQAELRTGPLSAHRTYFTWSAGADEDAVIADDHRNGRLPWVSVKPPGGTAGWWPIATGDFDADLRVRARRYATAAGPVVMTFHHEPTNDHGDPAGWASAFCRMVDVMADETGLGNVAAVPIIGEWAWNPANPAVGRVGAYLTAGVLRRMAFLGLDVYQNGSGLGYGHRIGAVFDWLADRGHPQAMVGIGETGASSGFARPAVEWWNEQWRWCEATSDRVGVVCYFNSTRNSKPGLTWSLAESVTKRAAFTASLASPVVTRAELQPWHRRPG